MRCLVTGASGFTGTHLVRFLREQLQLDVWGLVSPSNSCPIPPLPKNRTFRCDLRHAGAVREFVRRIRPDAIFHLAGKTRGRDRSILLEANVACTRVILESAVEFGGRVLLPGSAAEYGVPSVLPIPENHSIQPVTPYGHSKAAQVALAQEYARQGLPVYVARPFNLIGPGLPDTFLCGVLAAQVTAASPSDLLEVPQADLKRDFVDVRDVAEAYWVVLTRGQPGEIYNICTGIVRSILDIAQELCRLANRRLRLRPHAADGSEPPVVVGSTEKTQTRLAWSPHVPLSASLADMLLYEKKRLQPAGRPTP